MHSLKFTRDRKDLHSLHNATIGRMQPKMPRQTVTCTACNAVFTLAEFRALQLEAVYNFEVEPAHFELRQCTCGALLHIWTNRKGSPDDKKA